jgi:hypothetical protein
MSPRIVSGAERHSGLCRIVLAVGLLSVQSLTAHDALAGSCDNTRRRPTVGNSIFNAGVAADTTVVNSSKWRNVDVIICLNKLEKEKQNVTIPPGQKISK